MMGVWAIARQTFSQCIRTKVGGVFIILLAIAMLATPYLASDPAIPLADRIRTFLSYSTGVVAVMLGLVTIFLSAGAIASDIRQKQILIVAVKPLARWQYVVGRWLGVVLLDAVLVAGSGVAIYAISQHLRAKEAISPNDRRAVETEVFSARKRVAPDMSRSYAMVEQALQKRLDDLKNQGRYESALEAFRLQSGGTVESATMLLQDEYRKQLLERLQSVAPNMSLMWFFNGIRVAGGMVQGQGVVQAIDTEHGVIQIGIDRKLLGQLLYGRPVRVESAEGRVVGLGRDEFQVMLPMADFTRGRIVGLKSGDQINIELDPVIQVTYKATALSEVGSGSLYSAFLVQTPPPDDPSKGGEAGFVDYLPRSDAPNLPATLTVSSRAVDKQGRVQVIYVNRPRPDGFACSVSIRPDDISVLYKVASFETNFARGLAMILVMLMFIAALGVAAGTFLGFPVASLLVLVLLPFGLARKWLGEAVAAMEPDAIGYLSRAIVYLMNLAIPDIGSLTPGSALASGLAVPYELGTMRTVWFSLAGIALVLAMACVIFRKRELATVQV